MSRFIDEADRSQGTLLPETIDEYVCEENPVRVIGQPEEEAGATTEGKPPDAAADEPRVRHARGLAGRDEAARGPRLHQRDEVRRLPGADHHGQPATRATIQEEN